MDDKQKEDIDIGIFQHIFFFFFKFIIFFKYVAKLKKFNYTHEYCI